MNEGEFVRFSILFYQCAIFVCRSVSSIHVMTVNISNDHIHLWGSEVAPEADSVILFRVRIIFILQGRS